MSRRRMHRAADLGMVALVAVLEFAPLILLGLLVPAALDAPVQAAWVDGYARAIAEGRDLPQWMAEAHGGLGAPAFVFLHPLFYQLAGRAVVAGASVAGAIFAVALAASIGLGWLSARMVRQFGGSAPTAYAIVLVQACPCVLALFWFLGAYPWFLASVPLALFVWSLARLVASGEAVAMPAVALAVAGLVLSHLPSALVTLLAGGVASFVWFLGHRERRVAWRLAAALLACVAGVALAGFYLAPALEQLPFLRPNGWIRPPWWDWHNAFLFQISTPSSMPLHSMSLQWTLPLLVLAQAAATFGLALRYRILAGAPAFLLSVGMAALVLGSQLCAPLWAYFRPLQNVQFGFRFLGAAAIPIGLAFACVLAAIHARATRRGRLGLAALVLALSVLPGVGLLARATLIGRPFAEVLGATSGFWDQPEYETRWMKPAALDYSNRGLAAWCAARGLSCRELSGATHAHRWSVTARSAEPVVLPLLYFPGWRVTVDGQPAAASPDPETGLLSVPVPAGSSRVAAQFTRGGTARPGWILTAAGAALLLLMLWLQRSHGLGRRLDGKAAAVS